MRLNCGGCGGVCQSVTSCHRGNNRQRGSLGTPQARAGSTMLTDPRPARDSTPLSEPATPLRVGLNDSRPCQRGISPSLRLSNPTRQEKNTEDPRAGVPGHCSVAFSCTQDPESRFSFFLHFPSARDLSFSTLFTAQVVFDHQPVSLVRVSLHFRSDSSMRRMFRMQCLTMAKYCP